MNSFSLLISVNLSFISSDVTVGFSSPTYSGREDGGSLSVCIARSGDREAEFTVMLAVKGVTATGQYIA